MFDPNDLVRDLIILVDSLDLKDFDDDTPRCASMEYLQYLKEKEVKKDAIQKDK